MTPIFYVFKSRFMSHILRLSLSISTLGLLTTQLAFGSGVYVLSEDSPGKGMDINVSIQSDDVFEVASCGDQLVLTQVGAQSCSLDDDNVADHTIEIKEARFLHPSHVALMSSSPLLSTVAKRAGVRGSKVAALSFQPTLLRTQAVVLGLTTVLGAVYLKGLFVEIADQAQKLFVPTAAFSQAEGAVLQSKSGVEESTVSQDTDKGVTESKASGAVQEGEESETISAEEGSPSIDDLRKAGFYDFDR
ncbi:MAG: hypothetical protein OXC44_04690 [Proteobacteria bacterium]|nr:hypothetical protein [Pseudomonadota bacterium]